MTQPLWSAAEAAAAVGGRATGDWRATSVAIDTREIAPGGLFVALAGEQRDGHAFVDSALAAGAAAAMVSAIPDGPPPDAPLLLVDDTLKGLERLGAAARARVHEPFRAIAVTGSVGKTTVKSMLAAMLGAQAPTHAAERSFNNHWGVPLTLARMPRETRFGVFEIGMNHPGEITPLSRLARPHVALVTTVAAAHLAAFADTRAIAEAKAEIFAGLAPGAVAVLPRDNPHFELLAARARDAGAQVRGFGETAGEARLISALIEGADTSVEAEFLGRTLRFRLGAPGRHLAMNALAALLAAQAAGADPDRAAAALADWRVAPGRGDRFELPAPSGGRFLLIDDSYNANPTSMRAALETLAATRPGAGGRRVAFLTDMLELGETAPALHADLARLEAIGALDQLHAAGPLMRALHAALPERVRGERFADAPAMAEAAPSLIRAGDAVLVKGSNGSDAKRVAARLKALDASAAGR